MNWEVEDNSPEILAMLETAIEKALTECGMRAEEYAKNLAPVDTGLLRNSITYALDGESPAISSYKATNGDGKGSYSGQMPAEPENNRAVYIGTNVKYGIYQELGTTRMKKHTPFLVPAIADHISEYKDIIKENLDSYN